MKVLLCTNAFENITNGPAKFANLILGINQLSWNVEVRVLTEDIRHPIPGMVYKQSLFIPGVFRLLGQVFRMFQYHRRAMEIKKDYNFDVLIYNNAYVGLWSAIRYKNTIGFINDDNNAGVSLRQFLLHSKQIKFHIFKLFERLTCIFSKRIVVNSDYMSSRISAVYPSSADKIFRLYKCIELDVMHPPAVVKNNKVPTILFVKNDYKRGGLSILIAALKRMSTPIKLIVGGTAENSRHEITKEAEATLIEFEFLGIITQQEVYSRMAMADIFCVPSFNEAFGVTNIEAMYFGCAVVSTNVGGIPEVVDEKCGWLVDPEDPEMLCRALNECIVNDEKRKEKIHAAYLKIQNFSIERLYRSFAEMIILS